MADFFQIHTSFWRSARREGWTDDERQLGIYLLTCAHRNLEGLYRLPVAYVADDLTWPRERVEQVLHDLSEHGFAHYDDVHEVVFIVNALRFHAPKGPKQITGAVKAINATPRTSLVAQLVDRAREFAPEFAEALSRDYRYPIDTPSEGYSSTGNTPSIGVPAVADTPSKGYPSRARTEPEPEPEENPSSTASADDAEPVREDVHRLCHLLANLMLANDPKAKVAPDSKRWRDAARLLLDVDGRTEAEVESVIRFTQADDFERTVVLSMTKLRERFTGLALKASRGRPPARDEDDEARERRFAERAGTYIPPTEQAA